MADSNAGKILSSDAYTCPSRYAPPAEVRAWIKSGIAEAQAFIQTQRGFQDIDSAIALIAKSAETELPDKLSKIYVNWIKRQIREMVATLSGIRAAAGFKTDDAEFYDHAEIQNKLFMAWWLNTFADRTIRKMLQYAAVCGTGYLHVGWDPNLLGSDRGDISIGALGPGDVMPIQLPPSNDLQKAYAVIIREELPINAVRKRYWQFRDLIVPTRSAPTGMRAALGRAGEILQGALQILGMDGLGTSRSSKEYTSPTVDLFSVYVDDPSVNTGTEDVVMGEGNFAYVVPYVGKLVPTGINDRMGQPIMHEVTPNEARLYPSRRLIVCTETATLYDNASPWWHGMVPIIQFKMDDWPWDFLGYSLVRDTKSIQDTMNGHIRGVADSANCRLDPPMMADEDLVADSDWDDFSAREPGSKLKVNMKFGNQQPVRPVLPYENYEVPQWIGEYVNQQQEWISSIMGSKDITAMAKAQQVPSADTMEKYLEMAGALVQDISRNLELVMRDLGRMWGPLCFQFYPLKRRILMLGKNGVTEDDFTFNYGSMVPSPPPGMDIREAGRRHCFNFFFHVTPNSLTRITQTTQKLLYLQLWRDGRFPIDPWTVGEALDIPNMGPVPEGATSVTDRWIQWQKLMTSVGIDVQQMQMQAMQQNQLAQLVQRILAQGGQDGAATPQAGSPQVGRPEGRPPSGQVAPHFALKNDSQTGPRQVVAETP